MDEHAHQRRSRQFPRLLEMEGKETRMSAPIKFDDVILSTSGDGKQFTIYMVNENRCKTFLVRYDNADFKKYIEDWQTWPEIEPEKLAKIKKILMKQRPLKP